ncbi:hypothetical protein GCM10010277_87830 [Streptomyces longisporoflavus]|uniref:class I SAM-dependent methyltransferase n=1 Tax=Streptomyces longisporoflavus TaxID=28044 RepID=UPI00167EB2A9|nr:class I SAM-dependent methyltransferase [Streptomyces longisporoflavus]GGV73887.1 hypothetical protein GCM10010277_87830 [Streptomyces longisporoflavus]
MSVILHETSTPQYWDALYEAGRYVHGISAFECQMFRSYVDPRPDSLALDAGCARGDFAAYLGAWGLDVLGLDFSATAIAQARRDFKDQDHLVFDVHDFVTAPIPSGIRPGTFDLVVCRLSLPYLDPQRFLVDARRWLKPTGVLHITTHITERMPPGLRHRGLPKAAVEELATEWEHAVRYDLDGDGALTCVVLRGPYPHPRR